MNLLLGVKSVMEKSEKCYELLYVSFNVLVRAILEFGSMTRQ
jgi:hypothetical protein